MRHVARGARPALRALLQHQVPRQVFGAHTLRILPRLHGGTGDEAALQKLFGSEIQQRALELATALEGHYAALTGGARALDGGTWQEQYLYSRSTTISSGTSEILRTLLAERALGLPRS